MKNKLLISIIINIIFLTAASLLIYKKGGLNYITNYLSTNINQNKYSDYYYTKQSIYSLHSNKENNNSIVFLGDSITDFVEWSEFFGSRAINRGINGDSTDGVLNRIESILNLKPKKVFILLGVNDIQGRVNLKDTINNFNDIVTILTKNGITVYLQSVLPVNIELYNKHIVPKIPSINTPTKEKTKQINDHLRMLSHKFTLVNYIELNELLNNDGTISKEYTLDGIHLNGKGVAIWTEIIRGHIN